MKLTKRGFLQSIGSVLAAGTVADQAQGGKLAALEHDAKMLAMNPAQYAGVAGLNGPMGELPSMPAHWNLPSWKAKEACEQKKRFLKDADPGKWRSGQFTSHEQKKTAVGHEATGEKIHGWAVAKD